MFVLLFISAEVNLLFSAINQALFLHMVTAGDWRLLLLSTNHAPQTMTVLPATTRHVAVHIPERVYAPAATMLQDYFMLNRYNSLHEMYLSFFFRH